jgi:hypothetical protein
MARSDVQKEPPVRVRASVSDVVEVGKGVLAIDCANYEQTRMALLYGGGALLMEF